MFTLTKRTLSAAAVIAALSAPSTASAMINGDPGGDAASSAQQTQLQSYQHTVAKSFGPTAGGLAGPAVQAHSAGVNSARPAAVSSPEGFQWDDAGIGAAGIVALLGLGAGSVMAITRRRTHQTEVS